MSSDIPPTSQRPINPLGLFGDAQLSLADSSVNDEVPPIEASDWRNDTQGYRKRISIDEGKTQNYFYISEVLEEKLGRVLVHRVKELDSALALSSASEILHMRLETVRDYLNEHSSVGNNVDEDTLRRRGRKRRRHIYKNPQPRSSILNESSYRGVFENLRDALESFSIALNYFDEYTDKVLMASLDNMKSATMELHGILEFFRDDPNSDELHNFVTSRATSMTQNLHEIHEALERFIAVGIPCIKGAQEREALKMNNAATIATFFAGVVAGTLQLTNTGDTKASAVLSAANTLLLIALVFSIAAAFNCILAITVQKTLFAQPDVVQPRLIRIWLRQSHIWFLSLSVVIYLSGLVTFTFNTQLRSVAWIVFSFTLFSALGLAMISAWLLYEKRSLSQIIVTQSTRGDLRKVYKGLFSLAEEERQQMMLDTARVSFSRSWKDSARAVYALVTRYMPFLLFSLRTHTWEIPSHVPTGSDLENEKRPDSQIKSTVRLHRSKIRHTSGQDFQNCINILRDETKWNCRKSFERKRVLDLQFSPNGQWLAICFFHECRIYNTASDFNDYSSLWHFGRRVEQVEWSPSGNKLLTELTDCVRLWTYSEINNEFHLDNSFDFEEPLAQIGWINDEEFLVLMEDKKSINTFYKVDVQHHRTGYALPKEIDITEIYSLDQGSVVICIANLEIKGVKGKSVDCLVVYNMNPSDLTYMIPAGSNTDGKIEGKFPLLNNAGSLAVNKDGEHIVVSYETRPPEIWRLTETLGRIIRLFSLHYPDEDLMGDDGHWGEAFFTGPDEDIVGCPYASEIHFWRLDTREYICSQPIMDKKETFTEASVYAWHFASQVPLVACHANSQDSQLQIWGHEKAKQTLHVPSDPDPVSQSEASENGGSHGGKQNRGILTSIASRVYTTSTSSVSRFSKIKLGKSKSQGHEETPIEEIHESHHESENIIKEGATVQEATRQ